MSSRLLRVRRPDMRLDRPCAFFVRCHGMCQSEFRVHVFVYVVQLVW